MFFQEKKGGLAGLFKRSASIDNLLDNEVRLFFVSKFTLLLRLDAAEQDCFASKMLHFIGGLKSFLSRFAG